MQQREELLLDFWAKPLREMQLEKDEDLSTLIPLAAEAIQSTEQILF